MLQLYGVFLRNMNCELMNQIFISQLTMKLQLKFILLCLTAFALVILIAQLYLIVTPKAAIIQQLNKQQKIDSGKSRQGFLHYHSYVTLLRFNTK